MNDSNQCLEAATDAQATLTETESEFIASRDGFYQATVSGSGWPYVQYRGGPPGFLRVSDEMTICYADFRAKYFSVGNLETDDRISLILMDYVNQRRLKIWGRARVAHASNEPTLVSSLAVPEHLARVERAIVVRVEAFEWNCPQHIARRFTEAELRTTIAPLLDELESLRARVASFESGDAAEQAAGRNETSLIGSCDRRTS